MKTLRNFALCAIVAIGFACNATAKQDDKQDKKENKENKENKEEKIVVTDQIPYPTAAELRR